MIRKANVNNIEVDEVALEYNLEDKIAEVY